MNGTEVLIDGRPALRFERHLAHSIERVWRAVSEPDELACWFVAEVAWGPQAGEEFQAYGETGRITDVEPPSLLAWSWGVERYRFELSVDGEGCVLVFIHVFDPRRGPGSQHAAGWETYLTRLDAHLGGGFLSEEQAHAGFEDRQRRYRERFSG